MHRLVPLAFLLVACSTAPEPQAVSCAFDSQCKGDRICRDGACVDVSGGVNADGGMSTSLCSDFQGTVTLANTADIEDLNATGCSHLKGNLVIRLGGFTVFAGIKYLTHVDGD